MRTIKSLVPLSLIILFLVMSSGLYSCRSKPGQPAPVKVVKPDVPEGWTGMFDGETLDGWEVTNFGPQGEVYVSGGNIILEMGDGCTGINWKDEFPVMDYEVELDARIVDGNDFFCGMTFPVNASFCSLIVGGWGGPVVGLSSIDGLDASENETYLLKRFERGTWYHIRLKVSSEKIEAWINDEQVVDFKTEGRTLSIRPEVDLSRPFGICSWKTTSSSASASWWP